MDVNDPDKDLVEGVRNDDPVCQKKLVETYWTELNLLAGRILNDESMAMDVVQESMIKAINAINQFESKSTLRTWLHRIVTNESLMVIRKQTARKEDSLDTLMLEFDESGHYIKHYTGKPASLESLLDSNEVMTLVNEAIWKLPDKHRITLVMRDIEGYTCSETARLLETSEENIKVRLHRARLALRNLLGPILNEE